VLLIAGEVLVRLNLAAALEHAGMRVVPLVSGDEALRVLPNVPSAVVVIIDEELGPSSMSSFEAVCRGRGEHTTDMVLVSGRAPPELVDLPSGTYFLAKPFHHATLIRLIRDLAQDGRRRDKPSCAAATQEELTEALSHMRWIRG
jgi:DNA-binding NtrC family response regulator